MQKLEFLNYKIDKNTYFAILPTGFFFKIAQCDSFSRERKYERFERIFFSQNPNLSVSRPRAKMAEV